MNKIITIAIAFLLFIPFASINGNNVSLLNDDDILYVGGSGPNNYTSIQSAINDAQNGYTIYVYPGNYNESIVINKSISLIGIEKNGEKPVIHGSENITTVLIEASNCTISNFIIMKGYVYGLETRNASFVTIENNTIEYAGVGMGIYSSNNLIRNNTVRENKGIGIYIDLKTYDNTVIKNFIINNGWTGLEIHGQNHMVLYNNITKNLHGVELYFTSNSTISFNRVYSNQQYGIVAFACSNISILNNTIHDHTYKGLMLNECSNCFVCGNEMYANQAGLSIEATTRASEPAHDNVVTHNNIHENGVGIYLEFYVKDNQLIYNNLINNDMNAYFWFYEQPFPNVWNRNYWSDWSLAAPKPVRGDLDVVIDVLGFSFLFRIPWFMFDMHPAMEPYGNFTLDDATSRDYGEK